MGNCFNCCLQTTRVCREKYFNFEENSFFSAYSFLSISTRLLMANLMTNYMLLLFPFNWVRITLGREGEINDKRFLRKWRDLCFLFHPCRQCFSDCNRYPLSILVLLLGRCADSVHNMINCYIHWWFIILWWVKVLIFWRSKR